jgi:lipopolysaccharide export system protein LptC
MSPAQQSARERMLEGLRGRPDSAGPLAQRPLARRSRRVGFFKALLPLAAACLLLALAAAPSLREGAASGRVTYKVQNLGSKTAVSKMDGAQYRGLDQRGEPFTLTADTASQQGGSGNIVLSKPAGDLTMTSGAWLMLRSDAGLFDQRLQILGLTGNVTLYRNDGTVMSGPEAKINLKAGSAASDQPVQAAGPFGTLIAAGGFVLSDRGADVLFNGPATLTLNQAGPAPP